MPHMQQKHHSAGIFMIVGQLVAIVFLFGCLKLSAYSTFPMNIRRRCMNNCAMGARRLVSSSSSSKGRISSSLSSQSSESKAPFTQPPKGTRDFYPEDCRQRAWLHGKWRDVSYRFGFEEYDAPVLESEELYIRKAGEEITQQLYNFEDKGKRRVSLRPEMTPSLARMVLAKGNSLMLPLKWFAVPQCWREHYQWNMDIWGVAGMEAEAELLAAVVSCFTSLGITSTDVGIKVNSRKVLNAVLKSAGIGEELWAATSVLVDKLDKVPMAALAADFAALGLSTEVVSLLADRLQLKSIDELAAVLGQGGQDAEGLEDLRRLLALLADGYGIGPEWVQFDFTVVRGLAYYTGTVFEAFDKKGELRAICGGGRYDHLLQSMGGPHRVPAVGFGFGDAVVMELLRDRQLLPDLEAVSTVDAVVYAMDEGLRAKATKVAAQLRQEGMRVDFVLDARKPKWVLQRADRSGASVLVMLAAEEDTRGEVVLKDLRAHTQTAVLLGSCVQNAKEILKRATSFATDVN